MNFKRLGSVAALAVATLMFGGCASQHQPFDYAAFKAHRPRSIVVLPPVNNTTEVDATFAMLSQMTYPLAEGGYYVLPVALVAETFKQNGLSNAAEMHAVPTAKLADIFGADAGLYVTITKYGAQYTVFDSAVVVAAQAKLVDLKSGQTLWTGAASASSSESNNNNNSGGGLAGMLIGALVKQVLNNVMDNSYPVAGMASQRLLTAGRRDGLLYGPRSPHYAKEQQ